VIPTKDNLLEWLAEVQGLKDSLWEGAVLQLSIKYTEEYNSVPPTLIFNTIPFHPNVDQHSGRPCIDFLDNPKEWNGKLTMSSILLAIQVMLSNPELENAVNVEAAEMLKNNISLYRQMGHLFQNPQSEHTDPQEKRITTISFEDYHRMWSGIATSKAAEHFKAPCKMIYPTFIGNCCGWKAKNVKETGEWDENT
uniref:Ubiquitin conjugating enzyme E2 U n=1 Tax=Chelonoidis abingdonii TaxID=106734 RepID=A0A8C0JF45_CHEAB